VCQGFLQWPVAESALPTESIAGWRRIGGPRPSSIASSVLPDRLSPVAASQNRRRCCSRKYPQRLLIRFCLVGSARERCVAGTPSVLELPCQMCCAQGFAKLGGYRCRSITREGGCQFPRWHGRRRLVWRRADRGLPAPWRTARVVVPLKSRDRSPR